LAEAKDSHKYLVLACWDQVKKMDYFSSGSRGSKQMERKYGFKKCAEIVQALDVFVNDNFAVFKPNLDEWISEREIPSTVKLLSKPLSFETRTHLTELIKREVADLFPFYLRELRLNFEGCDIGSLMENTIIFCVRTLQEMGNKIDFTTVSPLQRLYHFEVTTRLSTNLWLEIVYKMPQSTWNYSDTNLSINQILQSIEAKRSGGDWMSVETVGSGLNSLEEDVIALASHKIGPPQSALVLAIVKDMKVTPRQVKISLRTGYSKLKLHLDPQLPSYEHTHMT
jgi:hypothetical protein